MIRTSKIRDIVDALKAGGVVSFPTDTVYAVAALTTAHQAIDAIYRFKQRSLNNPLAILAGSTANLEHYVTMGAVAKKLAETFMPGAFTLVLPKQAHCPQIRDINPGYDTVGVRVPDHAVSLEILASLGQAVVATSANISGQAPAVRCADVVTYFEGADITILDCDTECSGIASTIVQVDDEQVPRILREGEITASDVTHALTLRS